MIITRLDHSPRLSASRSVIPLRTHQVTQDPSSLRQARRLNPFAGAGQLAVHLDGVAFQLARSRRKTASGRPGPIANTPLRG